MNKNMNVVNLTPHTVRLNDGTEFAPSGLVARVASQHVEDEPGFFRVVFGGIVGLPDPKEGTVFVVSGMVAAAAKRSDVVSPATGHPACVRKDGQVWSVPGFVRA